MTYRLPLLVFAALAASVPASAAERNFTVTGFDRIRIDGPYRVRLTTGVAPFAKASGSAAALNGVSIEVQGKTLIVRKNPSGWGSYPGEGPGPIEIAIEPAPWTLRSNDWPFALSIARLPAPFSHAVESSWVPIAISIGPGPSPG